jgi:hypothetical protein
MGNAKIVALGVTTEFGIVVAIVVEESVQKFVPLPTCPISTCFAMACSSGSVAVVAVIPVGGGGTQYQAF